MSEYILSAQIREASGSNASKKLRQKELVPAELYQRGKENISLQIVEKDLDKIVNEAGTSAIIKLMVDGEEHNVLIRDFQKHPYKNLYLHVDFLGVNMDEAIKVTVPIVLLNRDNVRVQPSVLLQQLEEVEIETLPKHIPSHVELDVENMEYNDSFLVKDLDINNDENITVLTDPEELIVVLQEPQEEVIDEDAEEVDPADVEVIGEKEEEETEE
ncbi:50S ribosomal protein L25 [Helcococcus sueciensis]|uniref:50S ribosomal protein L25 n=1 Tax=Helcococcus sueciensis TaxID=241555 RepID=UPI0004032E68|nr:50S ribosomal protein L25 [Helcococcus sueciensis]